MTISDVVHFTSTIKAFSYQPYERFSRSQDVQKVRVKITVDGLRMAGLTCYRMHEHSQKTRLWYIADRNNMPCAAIALCGQLDLRKITPALAIPGSLAGFPALSVGFVTRRAHCAAQCARRFAPASLRTDPGSAPRSIASEFPGDSTKSILFRGVDRCDFSH